MSLFSWSPAPIFCPYLFPLHLSFPIWLSTSPRCPWMIGSHFPLWQAELAQDNIAELNKSGGYNDTKSTFPLRLWDSCNSMCPLSRKRILMYCRNSQLKMACTQCDFFCTCWEGATDRVCVREIYNVTCAAGEWWPCLMIFLRGQMKDLNSKVSWE